MKHLLLLITVLLTNFYAQAQFSAPTNVGFDFYNQLPKYDIADVDGDNDLDIIIASYNIITGLDHTDLYRNDGTGFFVKDVIVSSVLIDSKDGSVVFADIDGDLDQDVLITGITSSGLEITMYRNDGAGIFTIDAVQSANLVAVDYSTIKFADIDGDTDLDLAIMGEDSSGTPLSKIYTNDGTGNYAEDTVNSAVIYDASSGDLDFADVDGDTDLDLLISGYDNGEGTYLYLNDGSGNFTEDTVASSIIQDYDSGASVFVDIDGDTDLDLIIGGVVGSSSSTKMYTNNGSGVFTSVSDSFSDYISNGDIAVSDVDLDGDMDVFMSGTFAPTTTAHQTNLYKNDGSGNFTFDAVESAKFYAGFRADAVFKDLNNDGNEELINSNNNGILIYKNNSLPPIPEINIKGNNIDIIAGDATPDIADGTDFELLCDGDLKTNTFTIQNLLGADLEVISIALSGIGAGDYTISGVTFPLTVSSLASATFDLTFAPTIDGSRTATITVNNNDSDESVYAFDISGERQPDIVITPINGTFECSGGNDIINTSLSEVGLNYYLRNDTDNSIVDGPIAGTGNGVSLDTGILTEDTTFNMYATSTTVRGLKFDGVNETVYTSASSGGSLSTPNAITLESWVKFDALGQRKPIIFKRPSPAFSEPFYEYTCEVRANGEVYFALAINGTRQNLQTTGTALPINTWSHVACTWDGTTMRIYINGVPYSGTTVASGTMTSYSTLVWFGSHFNQTNYAEIELDDIRIWNVARTENQILNSKDTELNGNESGLIGYWKLNEGSGNTVYDSSPTNKNGTLVNMESEDRVYGVVDIGANSDFCQLGEIGNTVTIVGVNCAPEINIVGNSLDILNGDTTPILADGTDFETICAVDLKTNTFTIENIGSDDLEITSIVLSGVNPEDYAISGITLPLTLNKLTSTPFDVTFTSTALGVRMATVVINNNDADENAYTFNVKGEEFPEITVSGTTGTYICSGGNDIINTSSSEIGLEYFLRNDTDDSIIDGPINGTGSGLAFDTGLLTEDTTFNIFSSPISTVTNGLKFDGIDESIEIPNHTSLNPTNAITLESWVKFDGLGDRKPVIYKLPTSASSEPFYQYEFEIRDDGEVYFALSVNGSRKTLRTTGTSLPINTWSHIACTWDGSTMRIYINGVVFSNTTSAPGTLSTYTTNVRLGSHVTANYGEMELDDVRIWDVARTANEILNTKDVELDGNETGLVAYYKLNENVGSTATDSSINNNDGTLLNMEIEDWITGIVSAEGTSSNFCFLGELANKVIIVGGELSDNGLTIADTFSCDPISTTITITFSEGDMNYYIRNAEDHSVIAGPFLSVLGPDVLNTGLISETTTFEIYAELNGCSIIYAQTPTLTIGCDVLVSPKVYLQGAMLNSPDGLMRDDLRTNNSIPLTSPYSDGLLADASVLTTVGTDAIVDWIWVELRDANDSTVIIEGKSALLQRDGDVVAIDGVSPLSFTQAEANYYVVIKHLNHLGVMTANTVNLGYVMSSVIDFTNANNQITYGVNAQTTFGMPAATVALWAGNVGGDTSVKYQGSDNDTNTIKDNVLADSGNSSNSNLHTFTGYNSGDINMDGIVRYQGSGNDSNIIKDIVLSHPDNQVSPSNLFAINEQLPENN